ncbi:MAG: hypothetical protein ACK52I_32720 [Pseudomonadota bacterium]
MNERLDPGVESRVKSRHRLRNRRRLREVVDDEDRPVGVTGTFSDRATKQRRAVKPPGPQRRGV